MTTKAAGRADLRQEPDRLRGLPGRSACSPSRSRREAPEDTDALMYDVGDRHGSLAGRDQYNGRCFRPASGVSRPQWWC
jgi:hypothetical protein